VSAANVCETSSLNAEIGGLSDREARITSGGRRKAYLGTRRSGGWVSQSLSEARGRQATAPRETQGRPRASTRSCARVACGLASERSAPTGPESLGFEVWTTTPSARSTRWGRRAEWSRGFRSLHSLSLRSRARLPPSPFAGCSFPVQPRRQTSTVRSDVRFAPVSGGSRLTLSASGVRAEPAARGECTRCGFRARVAVGALDKLGGPGHEERLPLDSRSELPISGC